MNTTISFDPTLLYVHIANWEFQCCGEIPRVGGTVDGVLTLHPSHRPGYPAPVVHDWDPRSGLVYVDDVVARLGHTVTDPHRTDLIVNLGWHQQDTSPGITGVIELLVEETGRYVRGADGVFSLDPGTVEYRVVHHATRREVDVDQEGPVSTGVVAGIRVQQIRVPTPQEIDERLAAEELARRTVQVLGPVAAFGDEPPTVGSVIEIDFGDPRLIKNGYLSSLTTRVRAEVSQVYPVADPPEGTSWAAYTPVIVTSPSRLLIAVVVDPADAA